MDITKENDNLVIRLALTQDAFDAIDEKVGTIPALIGVIAGDEQGICNLIDMTYKGKDPQVGDFIVKTYYTNEEFIMKCEEWGLSTIEYSNCGFCQKTIFGSSTYKDGKICCYGCEAKNR